MRVIVTEDNIGEVLAHLSSIGGGVVALDTETYGLKWNDKLFALQLAIQGSDSYYFNFQDYQDGSPVLEREVFAQLHDLWMNPNIRWVMANAKYDMRRLKIESVFLCGEIYDILLMERLRYNKYFQYGLDACLKRMGKAKNDKVSLYIKDHKCYTMHTVEGKKTKEKDMHFERVPFSIMSVYGFDDVDGTLEVYEDQMKYFMDGDNKEQIDLVHSNIELVKTVYDMEETGIQLDMAYCKEQHAKEQAMVVELYDRIEQLTQMKFKAGPKWLTEVLSAQGIKLSMSEKGNPILDKDTLKAIPNAVAHYILEVRDHEKRSSTYSTLQRFADPKGILHTNYRLNGTDTLRFSSNDPNLQNIEACPKGDASTVRSAFIPRDGYFFVSIDYKTMEYRLCADVAGEHEWIAAINEGADPHQWVADMMDVDRKSAKTLNFMLLYGGGLAKLASALFPVTCDEDTLASICKVYIYKLKNQDPRDLTRAASLEYETLMLNIGFLQQADAIKKKYFSSLPAVARVTKQIQEIGVGRGFVRNRYGARYFIGDDVRFAYRLPNHLIQGTGACIIRSAMNKLAYQLEGMKSRMLLQIHDELIFEIHKDETHVVDQLKDIMEREYQPINGMLLKCDVEYSTESWNANTFKPWSEYGH